MKLMMEEVYRAFRIANVPEKEAAEAATAVAEFQGQINDVKRDLSVLKWITAATFAGVISLVLKAWM